MTNETHVFVCYGALSLDAAVRIAATAVPDTTAKHFLVMFQGDVTKAEALGCVSVMSPSPGTYSEWTRPFAVARWFSHILRGTLSRGNGTSIIAYIPHPFELPANHFAFAKGAASRLELLPDGLINYCYRTMDPESPGRAIRYHVRVALRTMAALGVGLRYRKLRPGHITQFDSLDYARTWHLSEVGLLTRKGKLAAVPSKALPPRDQRRPESWLFLDQELGQMVSPTLEDALRRRCSEYLRKAPRLIYKAHPRGTNRAEDLRSLGMVVEDLSSGTLAEELIGQQNVTDLVGFYSTPLVLLAPDVNLRRTAVFPSESADGLVRPRLATEIREALSRSNVQMITED